MDASRARFAEDLTEVQRLLDLFDATQAVIQAVAPWNEDWIPHDLGSGLEALRVGTSGAFAHRIAYRATIVLAYAGLERFVRDLSEAAAATLGRFVPRYTQLNEQLRAQHLLLTMQVATASLERAPDSFDRQWIENLVTCLTTDEAYRLNTRVFATHSANFRHALVREVFQRLGIAIPADLSTIDLASALATDFNGLYARTESVIDDLVERRNEVAHGDDLDLLERSTLRSMLKFLRLYADAIAERVFDALAGELRRTVGTEIGPIYHTWLNRESGVRSIAGLVPAGGRLDRGQLVFVAGPAGNVVTTVASIQRERVDVDHCGPSDDAFGVDLGRVIHQGDTVWTLAPDAATELEALLVD